VKSSSVAPFPRPETTRPTAPRTIPWF
jgi:hypothetical protein